MKIIVDTNIVFSALLNSHGRIGRLLLDSRQHVEFYSCKYLQTEVFRHLSKIQAHSKLQEDEVLELLNLIASRIFFVDENLLPKETLVQATKLVVDIDFDDMVFVALTNHLNGFLWTGDKVLIEGLKRKGYQSVITTLELFLILGKTENYTASN